MVIGIHGKIGSGKEAAAIFLSEELQELGYDIHHKLFAFKIKQFVELLTGEKMVTRTKDNLFVNGITDFTHKQKNIFFPQYGYSIGEMLQKIGTDLFRDRFHQETWIEAMFIDYRPDRDTLALDIVQTNLGIECPGLSFPKDEAKIDKILSKTRKPGTVRDAAWHIEIFKNFHENWIIPDTRFPNEADRIILEGGFIISVEGDPLRENSKTTRDKIHESEVAMDNYKNKKYIVQNDGTLEELKQKIVEIVKKERENGTF